MADNVKYPEPASGTSFKTFQQTADSAQVQAIQLAHIGSDEDTAALEYVSHYNGLPIEFANRAGMMDSIHRLRVSLPEILLSSHVSADQQVKIWEHSTAGAATITYPATNAAVSMNVTTANGDSAIRQTREYYSFTPGRNLLLVIGANVGLGTANCTKTWGLFDANNGIYFQLDGTTLRVGFRTYLSGSPVDVTIAQASWSIDKLNGSGPSGLTIATDTVQLYYLQFQWLGRMEFGIFANDRMIPCEEILAANVSAAPPTSSARLPVRLQVTNSGTLASTQNITHYVTSLADEGYQIKERITQTRVAFTSTTAFSLSPAVGTFVPILYIRLKTANVRAKIIPLTMDMLTTSNNDDVRWALIARGTLTGAAWTDVDTDSLSQFDITATAISGGVKVAGGHANLGIIHQSSFPESIYAVANIAGTADILTLAITRLSTSGASAVEGFASLGYREG